MKIENIAINLVKPYGKNAKKHDKKQIKQVADSIKRFGFIQPLVIDKDNNLIIGHCRLLAAELLDLREVSVIRAENLSEKEVIALRLADNKLNESPWEMDLVVEDLKGLGEVLIDLTGFDKDLLNLKFNFKNKELKDDKNNLEKEYDLKKCPNCGYDF